MAGLDPAIHVVRQSVPFQASCRRTRVDARVEPGMTIQIDP
jgi:hypothetical protein